jgi:asparagine synthase (glutamine-hydrolysing)
MSRILGICQPGSDTSQPDSWAPAFQALKLRPEWLGYTANLGPSLFAWLGRYEPLLAQEGGLLAVLEGQIYNSKELQRLTGRDCVLNPARWLISLYRRYGFAEALNRLNGDFAAALYDADRATLWLGRDRLGVKPLYYAAGAGFLAFASQPRALLSLTGGRAEPNRHFVARYAGLHYRYFDNYPDQSPYDGVAQLPAAHLLSWQNGRLNVQPYWSLKEQPDFAASTEALAERYRALFLEAVSLRLRAAPRPAFTLSGGLDSSSVLSAAGHFSESRPTAFSAVYDDKTFDESADIQAVVDHHAICWQPVAVNAPDVFQLLQEMITVHEEPVATATWLSHYLLCRQVARQGFGSLFGGLGGDELNAGEYEYFLYHFADLSLNGGQAQLQREVEKWVEYHDHPIYRKNAGVVQEGLHRLVDLGQPGLCRPDGYRLQRYLGAVNREYFDLTAYEPIMDHPFRSYLKNRAFQDLFRETLPCCLRAEDRQTTAFGLEHFLPFLDYRLVEFVFRVPGSMKIKEGVTKILLRAAMQDILPEETRTRIKKTGWNAPAHLWFADTGREPLLDLIHSRAFRQRGIYHLPEVERLVREHFDLVASGRPQENHMMFLWQLVNLELWLSSLTA